MKIAQISNYYQPINGGQEVYIDNLAEVLKKMGHNTVVYQPDFGVEHPEINRTFRIPYIGKVIPYADQYLFNLFLCLTKRRSLSKEDVIIVHYAFFSPSVWDYSEKTIVLSHGIEWHLEKQTLNDRIRQSIARYSSDRFELVANDTDYLRFLGLGLKPAQGYFEEVAPRKWFIPNCVDVDHFQRTDAIDELKDRKIIMVPRQITPDRGIDLAIRAFQLFIQRYADYYLYIVGSVSKGSEKYLEECKELVRTLGLEDRVVFTGFVKHSEMPYYYSSAVLTLIPTLRREGTSLSALESMACGTATVTTNVAGLQDLPSVQANPTPEDVSEKMIAVVGQLAVISLDQCNKVRSIFNLKNWSKAWQQVIETVSSRNSRINHFM